MLGIVSDLDKYYTPLSESLDNYFRESIYDVSCWGRFRIIWGVCLPGRGDDAGRGGC